MLLDLLWHPSKFPPYYHLVIEFKLNILPFPVWRSEKNNVPFQCLPFPMKLVSTTKYHYLIPSDSLASAKISVSCRNMKASSTVLQTYHWYTIPLIYMYMSYWGKIVLFIFPISVKNNFGNKVSLSQEEPLHQLDKITNTYEYIWGMWIFEYQLSKDFQLRYITLLACEIGRQKVSDPRNFTLQRHTMISNVWTVESGLFKLL